MVVYTRESVDAARREGYADGKGEGHRAGYAEGYAAAVSGKLPCGGEGCRYRPVEVTHDGEVITVMNSADSHRLSAALEELYTLRKLERVVRLTSASYRVPGRERVDGQEADKLIEEALAKVPR